MNEMEIDVEVVVKYHAASQAVKDAFFKEVVALFRNPKRGIAIRHGDDPAVMYEDAFGAGTVYYCYNEERDILEIFVWI